MFTSLCTPLYKTIHTFKCNLLTCHISSSQTSYSLRDTISMATSVPNTVSVAHEVLPPTAVDHCICLNFTSESKTNLILFKADLLEVYEVNVDDSPLSKLSSDSSKNAHMLPTISQVLEQQSANPASAYTSNILTLVSYLSEVVRIFVLFCILIFYFTTGSFLPHLWNGRGAILHPLRPPHHRFSRIILPRCSYLRNPLGCTFTLSHYRIRV
jgi:hypothetical protein